ncbi:MAG: translesion DNA synthesis-associated protein ImuA [Rhodoferax sp.]
MLSSLLSDPFPELGAAVWRATELGCASGATLATGHAELDLQLPGAGWPVGAISEILQASGMRNEWRLLLPALSRLTEGCVVLVGAPHVPFGPGLAAQGLDMRRLLWVTAATSGERLWAAEQVLRSAAVTAVLVWLSQARTEQLRRLQMAAQVHGKYLFLMRPAQSQTESSPAVLRLLAANQPDGDTLLLHIIKRRGPAMDRPLLLPARSARLAVLLKCSNVPADFAASEAVPLHAHPFGFLQRNDDVLARTASLA